MKKNLSSDFRTIAIIIFTVAIVLSIATSAIVYFLEQKKRYNIYQDLAEQFDNIFIYDFSSVEHAAFILGKGIVKLGSEDLGKISTLLGQNFFSSADNMLSWTQFSWVNTKGELVVSGKRGVLDKPINLSSREYITKSRSFPWKLVIGQTIKNHYGEYVIPIGVGVEDGDGHYIGTLSLEFYAKKIRDQLLNISTDFNCEFFIVSNDDRILISSNELVVPDSRVFEKLAYDLNPGLLDNPIYYNDKIAIDYVYDSKYYKFKILFGEDKYLAFSIFLKSILPKVIAIVSVAIISIVLLISLRRRIIIPLEDLSSLAEGNKNKIIADSPNRSAYKEISQLAISISKIQDFNKLLKEEVAKRTLHLKQALQSKQEFLNNISHEVRTPLQGILGISSELHKRWNKINEKDKRNYVRIVAESGDRLMQLMSNILDLSKLEEAKMSFNFRICEFRNIVKDSIKQIKPLLESNKALTLEVSYAKNIKTKVKCDRLRMQQVINNLLNNAIKYSKQGSISIHISNRRRNLRFAILDEGVGIPPKELQMIFQPFIESSKTKTKAGGKGLGLALCKEIILAHQGSIWAENHDTGSAFYFELPLPLK